MGNGIRIAVVGDLHYPALAPHFSGAQLRMREQARDAFYTGLMDSFFSVDAEIHVAVGDVTHEGLPEEWDGLLSVVEEAAQRHARNFQLVLGNHDTLTLSKDEIVRRTGRPRYFSMERGGARLVFLDSARELSPENWGGQIDGEQMAWLRGLETSRSPVFVFAHHPFPGTTAGSDEEMMSVEDSGEIAQAVSRDGEPVVYCNGHNHVHSLTRRAFNRTGFTFIQGAAALSEPLFRVLDFDPGQDSLRVTTLEVAQFLRAQGAVVREGLPGYFHPEEAAGPIGDRELNLGLGLSRERG